MKVKVKERLENMQKIHSEVERLKFTRVITKNLRGGHCMPAADAGRSHEVRVSKFQNSSVWVLCRWKPSLCQDDFYIKEITERTKN